MRSPKVYRSFDDFEREEIRPGERPHFTIDEFVDEIFLRDDFEFEFGDKDKEEELDFGD